MGSSSPQPILRGKRILIVEDEYYLADDLAAAFGAAGAQVAGPAGTVAEALDLIDRGRIDGAVIDANLHGESAGPCAERLESRGIPFLVATGYDRATLPAILTGAYRIEKPCEPRALVGRMADLLAAPAPATG